MNQSYPELDDVTKKLIEQNPGRYKWAQGKSEAGMYYMLMDTWRDKDGKEIKQPEVKPFEKKVDETTKAQHTSYTKRSDMGIIKKTVKPGETTDAKNA
jgi:septum formation inhibitor MinC